MDAGELDQQILIETATTTTNELGEEIPSWATDSQPWAKVIEGQGREFLKGNYTAEEAAVFKIYWREVNSKARVTWRGQTYRIDSVKGTRRGQYSYLHCVAQSEAN